MICLSLVDDTSCERCPASWFCPGDGSRLPCARCEGATCGQVATEHSFGAALECTTCPDGWVSSVLYISNFISFNRIFVRGSWQN